MRQKIITYNLVGFPAGFFDITSSYYYRFFAEKYKFVRSDNPDYVLYFPFCKMDELLKYPNAAIRIMMCFECLQPDFTFFDYWIGFDEIVFRDRYCQFTFFETILLQYLDNGVKLPVALSRESAMDCLAKKDKFCCFTYSRDREDGLRKKLFSAISMYKQVDSCGSYMRNVDLHETLSYRDGSKIAFEKRYKFSLVVEHLDLPNFVTEKVLNALQAETIPIYFGPREVLQYVNKERIILASDFSTIGQLLEEIKKLNENEDQYIAKLSAPPFADTFQLANAKNRIVSFFENILDQELAKARRRPPLEGPTKRLQSELTFYENARSTKFNRAIMRLCSHLGKRR